MELSEAHGKISQLPLVQGMGDEAKAGLAKSFYEVSDLLLYEAGEILIHGGYLSFDTGYVVLDGTVVIERPDEADIELAAPLLLGEMSQFRSADLRSATVRAQSPTTALQFFWEDLYKDLPNTLTEEDHMLFKSAIERQVWDRFSYKNIMSLDMFSDLSDELKLQVCLPFPSIADRLTVQGVDTLFNEKGTCAATGFILVKGLVRLFRKDQSERILEAPDILGIFPGKAEKGLEWTATAMAKGQAEVLQFSWETYSDELVRRLSKEDQQAFVASIRAHAKEHFVH